MIVDVHLPDLSFVRKIEESFSINRGVYNTIDEWFYNYGFKDVLERRMHILKFLQYIPVNAEEQLTKKRLFFSDGLTNTLENYVNLQEIRKKVVLA